MRLYYKGEEAEVDRTVAAHPEYQKVAVPNGFIITQVQPDLEALRRRIRGGGMSARVVQWIHDERGFGRIVVSSGNANCVTVENAIAAVAAIRRERRTLQKVDPLRLMIDNGIKSVTIIDYDTDQSVATLDITRFMVKDADTQTPD